MTRPYMIMQVAASVDGRIALGPNRTMFDEMFDPRTKENTIWNEIENQIKLLHHPQADMLGSNSLVREGDELKELPLYTGDVEELYQDYLPDDIVKRPDHQGWLVIVDGRGRLRNGFKGSDDRPGWHVLHLVSYSVPAEYLAFLQQEKIPYLIGGEERVDLKIVLNKLNTKLGVDTLVHTSGGKLAGALLREGLVDEVNLIIQPQLIGGTQTPTLFAAPDLQPGEEPTAVHLLTVQVYHEGYLWLRYRVER